MAAGPRQSSGSSATGRCRKGARDRTANRRRRNAAETRCAILEAAERRLLAGGPDAIRLQEIAADAGISHPAILHHFGSREGLVEAMVLRGIARLQAQFLEGWPSAREPDIEGVLERFYEVAVASWNGADARVAYSYRRESADNEAGPAEACGRANARGQSSTRAEGRTPLAGAGRVAVRRDRTFYSRAR